MADEEFTPQGRRTVTVVWWDSRETKIGEPKIMHTTECILDPEMHGEEAAQPNDWYEPGVILRKMIAIRDFGNVNRANSIHLDSVTALCNCEPFGTCKYPNSFRFYNDPFIEKPLNGVVEGDWLGLHDESAGAYLATGTLEAMTLLLPLIREKYGHR